MLKVMQSAKRHICGRVKTIMNSCTRTAHSNTVCTVCIFITYLNMYKSFVKYFCKDERRRLEEEEIVGRHFCFGRRIVIQVDMCKRDELHTISCPYWGCYIHFTEVKMSTFLRYNQMHLVKRIKQKVINIIVLLDFPSVS